MGAGASVQSSTLLKELEGTPEERESSLTRISQIIPVEGKIVLTLAKDYNAVPILVRIVKNTEECSENVRELATEVLFHLASDPDLRNTMKQPESEVLGVITALLGEADSACTLACFRFSSCPDHTSHLCLVLFCL